MSGSGGYPAPRLADSRVSIMPRKKMKRLRVTKEARRRARLGVGMPPPGRTILNKRSKPPKHKKSAADLIEGA